MGLQKWKRLFCLVILIVFQCFHGVQAYRCFPIHHIRYPQYLIQIVVCNASRMSPVRHNNLLYKPPGFLVNLIQHGIVLLGMTIRAYENRVLRHVHSLGRHGRTDIRLSRFTVYGLCRFQPRNDISTKILFLRKMLHYLFCKKVIILHQNFRHLRQCMNCRCCIRPIQYGNWFVRPSVHAEVEQDTAIQKNACHQQILPDNSLRFLCFQLLHFFTLTTISELSGSVHPSISTDGLRWNLRL